EPSHGPRPVRITSSCSRLFLRRGCRYRLGALVMHHEVARGGGGAHWTRVAVGIMVAHNPPHRSRRAALPHRAPALGSDAEAYPGIGMADTRGRKPAVDVTIHPLPRE